MGFEQPRGAGSDSFVVRVWMCGRRDVAIRLPVFGYPPAGKVVGDAGAVAAHTTAMWEMLLSGWQQHTAKTLGRVEQATARNLRGLWAADAATLIEACQTPDPGHEAWNRILPCRWVQADVEQRGVGYDSALAALARRSDRPQLGAVVRVFDGCDDIELNIDFVLAHDVRGQGTHQLGSRVHIVKPRPQVP